MGCKHAHKMLDQAEKLTCDKCLKKQLEQMQKDTIDQIVNLAKAQGWGITEKGATKENDSPKKEFYRFFEIDRALTQLLIDLMLQNNPNNSIIKRLTDKRQAECMDSCRLMRVRDNRSPEEIEEMIRFSQNDSFWKSNILSMPKLREKFDQLWLKAERTSYHGIQKWIDEKRSEEA